MASGSAYRAQRRGEKTELIAELEKFGYRVKELTEFQFRVNNRLDLYPTRARWHDIRSGKRGGWGRESALQVVVRVLGDLQKAETPEQPVTILNWRKFKSRFRA